MQVLRAFAAACLFGTTIATIGYNIKDAPAGAWAVNQTSKPTRRYESALSKRDRVPCSDNRDCQDVISTDGSCFNSVRNDKECIDGHCFVVTRDAYALCSCVFPGTVWDDACYRGAPGDDYITHCVDECNANGTRGNGGCDAVQDPCKAA